MRNVQRLKLQNFRRYPSLDLELNSSVNILVGDNEAGKSTILLALELVFSGSRARLDSIGLENLFNAACVDQFLNSERNYEQLPVLYIEAYLNEQENPDLNGKNNSLSIVCDGISLVCEPNDDYSDDIRAAIDGEDPIFPFEFYEPRFLTYAAKPYNVYSRPLRHLSIDSSQISNEYATRAYIGDLYLANAPGAERSRHRNEYRKHKQSFAKETLADLNSRVDDYDFTIRTSGKSTLESDLTISQNGITIEHRGKGQQCFIKTAFALKKPARTTQIHLLLLEEPENHLSHVNMRRLIGTIAEPSDRQIVISTHSSFIAARLDLRKCVLMNSSSTEATRLDALTEETAAFFMKAPQSAVLEYILAKKALLVEGAAEYILVDALFRREAGCPPEDLDTHIISVGGTSFKRYLELAKLLNIRTAVVRDNDGDYQSNCVDAFSGFAGDSHIRVFSDQDDERRTFEICIYRDNTALCDRLFSEGRRTKTAQEYMLSSKTEAAFALLQKAMDAVEAPAYISEAIRWIRE